MPTSDHRPAAGAENGADYFATTRWTLILAAGHRRLPEAERALEELCGTYWFALYAYIRRRGHTKEDAEDLVQSFFAEFLAKNYLERLSREKGKFRAFLLACLKHFLANQWDRTSRQKRGGGAVHLSLAWHDADTRYRLDPADQLTPDKLYDRAWTVALLERVLARLRQENRVAEKQAAFEKLKAFLTLGQSTIPYAEASASLGMSEAALRVAVHRLRRRYKALLRDEIMQTLADPQAVDEEMQALRTAFTPP